MKCAKNMKLLSDYHDKSLNMIETARVRMHLMICLSCREMSMIWSKSSSRPLNYVIRAMLLAPMKR